MMSCSSTQEVDRTPHSPSFLTSPMDQEDNRNSVFTQLQRLNRHTLRRNIERRNSHGPITPSKHKRNSGHDGSACIDGETLDTGFTTQYVSRQKQRGLGVQ